MLAFKLLVVRRTDARVGYEPGNPREKNTCDAYVKTIVYLYQLYAYAGPPPSPIPLPTYPRIPFTFPLLRLPPQSIGTCRTYICRV